MNAPRRRFVLLPLLALLLPLGVQGKTTVTGMISQADGTPLPLAHVHLYPLSGGIGMTPLRTVEVAKNGSYRLEIDEPGYYRVVVTGVNHNYISVPVFATDDDASLKLDINPAPLHYNTNPEELQIIGDWNDFKFDQAEPMKREKDGTYTYTIETTGKSVSYQIMGLTDGGGRSVNAPGSDSYVYDGGGDYRSIMKVKPGKVTIRFNPKNLPSTDLGYEPSVQFTDPIHTQLWEIEDIFNRTEEEFRSAVMTARANGTQIEPAEIWEPVFQIGHQFMSEEHPESVQKFAALNVARTLNYVGSPEQLKFSEEMIEDMQELLPPDEGLWAAAPSLPSRLLTMGNDKEQKDVLEELAEENPDRVVRAMSLSFLVAMENDEGNKEEAREYYEELKEEYSDLQEASYVLTVYDPDRRIQVGNEVPDFEVVLMASGPGGSTVQNVSRESMKGRYYLIDFWATWCGPCVGEMPSLHTAYEKFHGENFEVLSLSFDASPDKVDQFREAKWKMPWLHSFVSGGFGSDLAKNFEVMGIPKPILVGPNGTIVATEGDLRGANLEKTLERFLGDGQASR